MLRLLCLLPLLPLLLAAPALAAPPIDGDGAFVHVLTLKPSKLAQPLPIAGPVRLFAHAADDRGGVLLIGDGEYLYVDAQGRLDRQAFESATAAWPTFGRAVLDAGGKRLAYCDAQNKSVRRIDDGGKRTVDLGQGSLDVNQACELFTDGKGGYLAVQSWPQLAWRVAADGKIVDKFAFELPVVAKPGSGLRPCGQEPGGRALAALERLDTHELSIVRLDGKMQPDGTLWTLDLDAVPEGQAVLGMRLSSAQGCAFAHGHAVFHLHNQVLVFDGQGLVSAMRSGQPFDVRNSHVQTGVGPYAFQILSTAQVLGARELGGLLVAERDQGEIKLFAPRAWLPPVAEARAVADKALARGEFLRAQAALSVWLGTHPGDVGAAVVQARSLLDAGWWETAEALARQHLAAATGAQAKELETVRVRARSQQLVRWTQRSHMGQPIAVVAPGNPAPALYDEAVALAKAAPGEPQAAYAAARLARILGRHAAYLQHLQPLEAALAGGKLRPAQYPELFDVLVARGDRPGMARFLAQLDGVQPEQAVAWQAQALRAGGKFAEALDVLAKVKAETPTLLTLRATLQADKGELDAAILTWTRVLALDSGRDPRTQAGVGLAYLRRGLPELAVQALLKAVDGEPDNAAWRSNLAEAYAGLDKREAALQQLFGALAARPSDPLLRHQLEQLSAPPRPAGTDPPPPGAIAVLALGTAGGSVQRAGLGDLVATMLTTVLVEGGVPVVERARLQALLQEQKLQRSAHVDPATAVRAGKLAGATRLVMGNAAEFEGRLTLDVRLVEVQSGKVLAAAGGDSAVDVEALRKVLGELRGKLGLGR